MGTFNVIDDGGGIVAQCDELTRIEQRAALRGALRDIMRPTYATAKELVPTDTGALKASLKLRAIARTRRGIGVLISTTGELTKAQAKKNKAFSGENFYGAFVHWGHKFTGGGKPNNASIGLRYKQRRTAEAKLKIQRLETSRERGRFPGIPFLKEAGDMHRERMDRELKEKFAERVQEALAKRG